LLEALQFIFDQAGDRPCVINVSLGTNSGPHDGSTLVETGIDRLIQQKNNRAVAIAASNSFSDGIHAASRVAQGASSDLKWRIEDGDQTGNELDIWYSGSDQFAVELIAPDGASVVRVEPGQNRSLLSDNQNVAFIANRLGDPNNGDNNIGIFLDAGLPSGDWLVRLHGVVVQNGSYHAWIERDDAGQSSFAPPNDNSHTIGSISSGHQTVVVGSYDAHKDATPISFFSSAGPTRDGRQKPEVSAPGHNVLAAHSRTGTGVTRKSGTSMASPAVTGSIALLLAEAQASGRSLAIGDIRDILTRTARKNPPPEAENWDPQFGFGRVSAAGAAAQVVAPAPEPGAAAKRRRTAAKHSKAKAVRRGR
jgi:subtilisin family serine protease